MLILKYDTMKNYLWIFVILLFALVSCKDNRVQSLAGEWQIMLDPEDVGIKENWQSEKFEDKINLPGSLQEKGFGDKVSTDTKWTGRVIDKSWYTAPKYEKYREEGNVKVPFWLNPDRHYIGVAWYQKEIDIPNSWINSVIEIELERCHWETTLYMDGKEVGKEESLSTPHRFIIKPEKGGKHLLAFRVDNRLILDVGIDAHSVSDHTQTNWNGIVGKMEVKSRPNIYIDNVQIYPNIKSKTIKVNVEFAGKSTEKLAELNLEVKDANGKSVISSGLIKLDDLNKSSYELELNLGADAKLWNEFTPNTYTLTTKLKQGKLIDTKEDRFGLREFTANGTRFEVNGQPIFLRGTLECAVFPLTGYPATDEEYWAKIYKTCKDYGLNHVRFHSWCPPKVAFEVADEMGIYLQVEAAGWTTNILGDGTRLDEWYIEEGNRILKEYGNHPSFVLMCYGNEPGGKNQEKYLTQLIDIWRNQDNRHLYTSAGGWPYLETADYWNSPDPRIQGWGEGLNSIINSKPPTSDYDFAHKIAKTMPTVSHEIGQWCVYPNYKEIKKYTGLLKAKNFEIFQETLEENHMADLAEEFLYSSGRLQTLCYKADIEGALRTPGFAGFQLLGLGDFPGQGSALVGTVDVFWEDKGYTTGKEYSMFSSATVPLIRLPKMVWNNDETMNMTLEFAHFGEKPIKNANIQWSIADGNKVIANRKFIQDLRIDNCIKIGNISFDLSNVKEAKQLTIKASIADTDIHNEWNVWVYPRTKIEEKAVKIVSQLDTQTLKLLEKGESVLLTLSPDKIVAEKGGDIAVGFSSIFWNTAWTGKQAPHELGIYCNPEHPVLSQFPTEKHSDFQWWDVVTYSKAMVIDDFSPSYRPLIHLIDDWFTNRKLAILFEGKVRNGKLMVTSIDFEKYMDKRPATKQLLKSIIDYMNSDSFNPSEELKVEDIRALYK